MANSSSIFYFSLAFLSSSSIFDLSMAFPYSSFSINIFYYLFFLTFDLLSFLETLEEGTYEEDPSPIISANIYSSSIYA